jgi:signal transduction histidine kinase
VLGVVGIGLLVYLIQNPAVDRQIYTRLEQLADDITQLDVFNQKNFERSLIFFERFSERQNIRVLILSPDAEVIFDSAGEGKIRIRSQIFRWIRSRKATIPDQDNMPWLVVWRSLNENNDLGYFMLGVPRPSRVSRLFSGRLQEVFREDLLPPLMRAGAAAIFLALILAYLISRWITTPLSTISRAADKVASGIHSRVPVQGPEEVQVLAEAFNTMTDRVKASQESQKEFIANVSHELKTPLTSIRGFAQAISDGTAGDPDDLSKAAEVIRTEAGRMHRLVLDLLDLARFDAGILEMDWSQVNIGALLRHVVDKFSLQAAEKEIVLVFEQMSLSDVMGDEDRLIQVFTNLVDNALKHTSEGGKITISAFQNGSEINVWVKDSGRGIPGGEIDRIFERFYQVDKSRSGGQNRGTGLGLPIAREIVRTHGGEIEVESQPGQGTTFMVKIPVDFLSDKT